MSSIQAIVLGLIEGFTEFLPISSTAHLILAQKVLNINQTDFVKSFTIIIQLGAILAVLVLYGRRVVDNGKFYLKILTAFVPTALIGFIVYKIIKNILFENIYVMAIALIVGGILFIYFEKNEIETSVPELKHISFRQSFLIGLIQSLSVIPGVSRAGATILGGLYLGIGRRAIVEFSFLLAIPTMIAASGYDIIRNLDVLGSVSATSLAVGFVVSFAAALGGIKFLVNYISTHNLSSFGWYRIILGSVILVLLAI